MGRKMKKMKKRAMTPEERQRLHGICYNSRLGKAPSVSDQEFFGLMFKLDPKGYGEVQREAARQAIADYSEFTRLFNGKGRP